MRKVEDGGHTLKCQLFCFRAAHSSRGGCEEQRVISSAPPAVRSNRTALEDLVDTARFRSMSSEKRAVVQDVLHWVQSKENQSQTKARKTHESQTKPESPESGTCRALRADEEPDGPLGAQPRNSAPEADTDSE